jgi:hypothetical protein
VGHITLQSMKQATCRLRIAPVVAKLTSLTKNYLAYLHAKAFSLAALQQRAALTLVTIPAQTKRYV